MMHMEDVPSDEDEDASEVDDEEDEEQEAHARDTSKVGGGKYAHGNSMKEASGGSDEEDEDEDEDYDSEEDNPNIVDRYAGMKAAARPVQDGGDVLQADMGQGLPYRPGSFDGVISISALQWLCYANSSDQDPRLRLNRFFSSLYSVLKRDAKAVLQFYPENAEQVVIIAQAAARVGFAGGVLVDYPNSTKAKKYFLCLSFERTYQVPQALGTGVGAEQNNYTNSAVAGAVNVVGKVADRRRRHGKGKVAKKSTEWIKKKKELHKRRGKDVKTDSKFTGRRRARGF
jgi:18S rRNA (guanine1575-N7)-methyltransferase